MDSSVVYCEDFYSIQGEGFSTGVPAVFLRLAGCNLQCLGFSYKDPNTGEHLGCDSKAMWRRGIKIEFDELLKRWRANGWLTALANGAHLVVTGGEPLVQQKKILAFLRHLDTLVESRVYVEVETNGTISIKDELLQRLDQINISPKLSCSGESRDKALVPAVLEQLSAQAKVKFKFVVSSQQDVDEIIEYYKRPFAIPSSRIWLMPEGGTQQQIAVKQQWVVEQCKKYSFNYSPRLQIDIWNEVTGV